MRIKEETDLENLYENIDQAETRKKYNEYLFNLLSPDEQERYGIIPDMEGPSKLRSGKIVYYDNKEGKYYDRDSDMYMSYDEVQPHMDYTPKTEM